MFRLIEADQPLAGAENDRVCRHHFSVQPRMPGELPVKGPATAVGPVHHRRDREAGV